MVGDVEPSRTDARVLEIDESRRRRRVVRSRRTPIGGDEKIAAQRVVVKRHGGGRHGRALALEGVDHVPESADEGAEFAERAEKTRLPESVAARLLGGASRESPPIAEDVPRSRGSSAGGDVARVKSSHDGGDGVRDGGEGHLFGFERADVRDALLESAVSEDAEARRAEPLGVELEEGVRLDGAVEEGVRAAAEHAKDNGG